MTFQVAEALSFLFLAFLPALGVTSFLVAAEVRRGRASIGRHRLAVLWWAVRLLAWMPSTALGGFFLLVVVAWVDEAKPPTPLRLDFMASPFGSAYTGGPHPCTYDPAHSIALTLGACSLIGIVLVPGLFALLRAAGRPTGMLSELVYYVSWASSVALVVMNPNGLVEWFTD